MTTIYVSTQEELLSAMKTASGGDTILLADGDYGTVTLKNDYASSVTIQAENAGGASFEKIHLDGATNITLDGLNVEAGLSVQNNSSYIEILNVDVNGVLYLRNVDNIVIDNVDVSGGQYGILLNTVSNFSVTNSYIHDVTEDLMRITGNSYNGLVENNVIGDTHATKPTHPDIIQLFGANGVSPHDITISGNLLYDIGEEGMVPAQGIFVSDPQGEGYYNIVIEDNLINTASTNTIYINGGDNSVQVVDNTLVSRNGGGGNIRLVSQTSEDGGPTITGNVVNKLILESKSTEIEGNYVYGKYGTDEDLSELFSGTDFSNWESYIPVEGSGIDFGSGYGAEDRMLELLAEAAEADAATASLSYQVDAVVVPSTVYEHDTTVELKGRSGSYVSVEHQDSMAIDEGSISLSFNADVTSSKRGLISKDSSGSGDAISAWIENGTLMVRFQDGEQTETISYAGIEHNTDYDLLISFDEDSAKVWLDDILIGEVGMDIDLSENTDSLVIGGFNGKSTAGSTDNTQYFFDGTISDVKIYDTALSADELASLNGEVSSTEATVEAGSTNTQSAEDAASDSDETQVGETSAADTGSPIVYDHGTTAQLKGTFGSYVTVAHQDSMAIDEGSISLSFNADVTGWKRGLVSKDSSGSGDAISAWIEDGTLIVQFQDGENTASISYAGIETDRDYDLLISFDEETAKVWLDETLVGEVAMDVDLSENSDSLLIGAFNGKSSNGTTDNRMYYFDGTISDVKIYDSALTPEELAELEESNHISTLDSINNVQDLALY